jgi:hypothetical protein
MGYKEIKQTNMVSKLISDVGMIGGYMYPGVFSGHTKDQTQSNCANSVTPPG